MPMRKHDECARACRRHAALPLPAVDFVAVRARAAVHSAAAVAPTSAAPVLRLISQHFREENHPLELHEP